MARTTKAAAAAAASKASANVTAEQIATTVGATGKDFRRWLRAFLRAQPNGAEALAGKGGRYAFTEAVAAQIVVAYGARQARQGNTSANDLLARVLAPAAPVKPRARRAPRAVVVSHVAPIGALEAPSASQS